MTPGVSVIIPVFNEEESVEQVLKDLRAILQRDRREFEIIVVDDGSTDRSGALAAQAGGRVIRHPENMGYGASLKTGVLAAIYDWIVIADGDGSYDLSAIPTLISYLPEYHMVVGARQGKVYAGSLAKDLARRVFRFLTEFGTGRSVPDINSGLRAFRKDLVLRFFDTLSRRFSFTTTLTLAAMLNGYFVKYVPIAYFERKGQSKVHHFRDTLRALQIIIQSILYYNPLKLFLLPAGGLTALGVLSLILAAVFGRLLLVLCASVFIASAVIVFTIGLVADVTARARGLGSLERRGE